MSDQTFQAGDRVAVYHESNNGGMFRIGDVRMEYEGDVVAVRENGDCLVRYVIPNARKPYYETWWPVTNLTRITA